MPTPFPPGDTRWRRRRPPSPWRNFHFVLGHVLRAIEPASPLARMLADWNEIAHELAEPPRQRQPQMALRFPAK